MINFWLLIMISALICPNCVEKIKARGEIYLTVLEHICQDHADGNRAGYFEFDTPKEVCDDWQKVALPYEISSAIKMLEVHGWIVTTEYDKYLIAMLPKPKSFNPFSKTYCWCEGS